MNTLAEIEAAAEALPPQQQLQLLTFLEAQLGRTGANTSAPVVAARRPGLHPGQWDVALDFDAPLPDEFWLGRDA